jgi:Tfp pilus assembly protein PilV
MKVFVVSVLALAALTAGCGQSEEEPRAEEAAQAAEETAQSAEKVAESAAAGLEQMTKGHEAMAAGGTATVDGKPVEPVRFQDQIALLPEIDGWEQQKPSGERMTSPLPTATAKARYTRDNASIDVEIVDSAFNQLLLAPLAMFLQSGYSTVSTSGYEKSTTVNGQPGWEKWDSDAKNGEINALVNKRFLVSIEGYDIEDAKVLQDVAARLECGKLGALNR